jgi:DNA invertase Pin-like site-specific DNA recombinase
VPHALAGAFQKARGILKRRAVEKADVHMSLKGVDVSKRRVLHTGDGAAIVHIELGAVDVVVVYKIDRLSRSLMDFAKLVEVFDRRGMTFVSVTQAFNTTTSMGRLTLNVLLSFAQFEREVTGERIRDKFAASKRRGI